MDESHQFFPSGPWQGVYKYPHEHDGSQHQMRFHLNFKDGTVSGNGSDDVGPFTWRGTYSTDTFRVVMVKSYASHTVDYNGMADESGIYGGWDLCSPEQKAALSNMFGENWRNTLGGDQSAGGFHIWPSSDAEEEEAVAEEIVVKELVISQP